MASTENSISSQSSAPAAAKPADPAQVVSHYEISLGAPIENQVPLPSLIPATVKVHFVDGSSRDFVGGRGWDINKDGRMDMLEIVDADGKDRAYLFDFDADGRPDFVRVRGAQGAQPQANEWQEEVIATAEGLQRAGGQPGASSGDPVAAADSTIVPKSFSGIDMGLALTSTKLEASDRKTGGKATIFSKSNLGLALGYAYFPERNFSYRFGLNARNVEFAGGSDLKTSSLMLLGGSAGVGLRLSGSLSMALLLGYEQQPYLRAADAVAVELTPVFIPSLNTELFWDAWSWGVYDAGAAFELEYGFGGKSSGVEATADLGYRASIYAQRHFATFVAGVQIDWSAAEQTSKDVEQDRTDFGLQLQMSMLLGGGAH